MILVLEHLAIPFLPLVASLVVGLFGKAISEKTAHRLTIFAVFLSFVFSGIVVADS